jgi:hypothetical protein
VCSSRAGQLAAVVAGGRGDELATALSWRELLHLTARTGGRYGAAAFAHVPLRLGRVPVFRDELVARAHDAGIRLVVWTVDAPDTMHRLLDAGVDGLITDRPDLLREVLVARGQWHAPAGLDAPLPACRGGFRPPQTHTTGGKAVNGGGGVDGAEGRDGPEPVPPRGGVRGQPRSSGPPSRLRFGVPHPVTASQPLPAE